MGRLVIVSLVLAGCGYPQPADVEEPVVAFDFAMSSTDEQSGTHAIGIRMSALPLEEVTIRFVIVTNPPGTAKPGLDFVLETKDLIVGAGEPPRDVILTIVNDDVPEPDEQFVIRIASESVGVRVDLTKFEHLVTIRGTSP